MQCRAGAEGRKDAGAEALPGKQCIGNGQLLRRNRIGAGTSESVIEFVRANGARRAAMRGILAGMVVVTIGFFGTGAGAIRANERPSLKGPNEDGTKQ